MSLASLTQAQRVILVRMARPDQRFILGCERCASPCVGALLCACCKRFKTRTSGGNLAYYPDDDQGHYRICSREELHA